MIKNLRKKFMIVAMCSMLIVLTAIVMVFNILNYVRSVDDMDHTLHMIAENNGRFPSPQSPKSEPEKKEGMPGARPEKKESASKSNPEEKEESSGEQKKQSKREEKKMSPETPYQTRYFSVWMDENGTVISSNLHNIAAVSEEEAEEYAKEVFASQKAEGFQGIYRYRRVKKENGTMVIFLDSQQKLESFRANLLTSLFVSVSGLLAVLVLVLVFSRIAFRPVAEAYVRQKRFITDASHEIKTPLAIIDANIEVIEMENGKDEWTESSRRQVKRLAHLTQQMITLAKLDEEGAWKQKSEFSFTDAAKESIQPFEVFAKTCGKTVEADIREQITILGEEKLIRQMISILLDNAVKYSLPESTISVSLTKKGKVIRFEACNETEVLPEGNLDILFERFYRLDASRNSETGGSGIGLSVARAIVESHHGKIKAQSEDGRSILVTAEFR